MDGQSQRLSHRWSLCCSWCAASSRAKISCWYGSGHVDRKTHHSCWHGSGLDIDDSMMRNQVTPTCGAAVNEGAEKRIARGCHEGSVMMRGLCGLTPEG